MIYSLHTFHEILVVYPHFVRFCLLFLCNKIWNLEESVYLTFAGFVRVDTLNRLV